MFEITSKMMNPTEAGSGSTVVENGGGDGIRNTRSSSSSPEEKSVGGGTRNYGFPGLGGSTTFEEQQGAVNGNEPEHGPRVNNGFGNRRLYIGNMSDEVTEEALRKFFEDNGVDPENISKVIMRNGYAFVECHDAEAATMAAEKCNMKTFMNTVMRVEAAAEKPGFRQRWGVNRQRPTTQLLIKNCGADTNVKDLQLKFSQYGPVTVEHGIHPGTFVVHTIGTKQSDSLIEEFHGKTMGEARIVVHSIPEGKMSNDGSGDAGRMPTTPRSMPWRSSSASAGMDMDFPRGSTIPSAAYANYQSLVQAAAEPPLKILVPNEYVGAVIGRGGATIRAISKGTGARLDIFRNCSRYDVPEKPVTIYGPPEKASKACRKILEIIAQESNHNPEQKHEISLKMFAQDSYIGRVIGKGGNVIKKIMADTQTKIHISTQSDFMGKDAPNASQGNRHYVPPVLERLITIRGSIDGMCTAETIISEKLREAYQNEIRMFENGYGSGVSSGNGFSGSRYTSGGTSEDEYIRPSNSGGPPRRRFNSRTPFTLSNNPNSLGLSGYIPGGTYSTSAYSNSASTSGNGSYSVGIWNPDHHQSNLSRPESINMYIPDDVVGALIGRRGSNIRQIIQQTGASVKIMEETLIIDDNPMRRVVINGVIDALFKAQYFIYDKVVEEGKGPVDHQIDEIRLTVEMSVPTEMVGRLIGKAGQNIRDIQKNFLCRIKFMTDPDDTLPPGNPGETYVRITGNYNAFLGAQRKIREMLIRAMTRSFHGFVGGRRRDADDSSPEQSPTGSANVSGNSDDASSPGVPGVTSNFGP